MADQHELRVANFHVAPRFVDAQAGEKRGRHEWWIELKMTTPAAPAPEVIAACLDVQLERRNDDYEAKRKGSGLELPWVRLVAPGTFEHWLRARGKWGEQNKMPRCRSDRG